LGFIAGRIRRGRGGGEGSAADFGRFLAGFLAGVVSCYPNRLYTAAMTNEASLLMAEALRVVKLDGSFAPADLGVKIGLRKPQAEAAARELSNAGVLVLVFDCSAYFSPDFRKARAKAEGKATGKTAGKKLQSRSASRKRTALAEPAIRG
jgi:hypothetical protein